MQAPRTKPTDLEFAVRGGIPDLGSAWSDLKPRLALSYPFELDIFQKEAVLHLEAGHSVSNHVYFADLLLGCRRPSECMPWLLWVLIGQDLLGKAVHDGQAGESDSPAVLHPACRNGTCVHCVARLDPDTTPCSVHSGGRGDCCRCDVLNLE